MEFYRTSSSPSAFSSSSASSGGGEVGEMDEDEEVTIFGKNEGGDSEVEDRDNEGEEEKPDPSPEFLFLSGESVLDDVNGMAIKSMFSRVYSINHGDVCAILYSPGIIIKVYPISNTNAFSSFMYDEYASKTIQSINKNPKTPMAIPTFIPYHGFVICRDGITKYINYKLYSSFRKDHGFWKRCGIKIMVNQEGSMKLSKFMEESKKHNINKFIKDMAYIMLVGSVSINNMLVLSGYTIKYNDATIENWLVTSAHIGPNGNVIQRGKSANSWATEPRILPVYGLNHNGDPVITHTIELKPNESGIILSFSDMNFCSINEMPCIHLNDPKIATWGITTKLNKHSDFHCFMCSIYLKIKHGIVIDQNGKTNATKEDKDLAVFISSHIDEKHLLGMGVQLHSGSVSVLGESFDPKIQHMYCLVEGRLSAFPTLVDSKVFAMGMSGIHMAYNRINMAFEIATTSTKKIPHNFFDGFLIPRASKELVAFFNLDLKDSSNWGEASRILQIFDYGLEEEDSISSITKFIKDTFFRTWTVNSVTEVFADDNNGTSQTTMIPRLWFWKQLQTASLHLLQSH